MRIDGDAARAARREAAGEPIVYALGGEEFTFPVELPLSGLDVTRQASEEKWDNERFLRAWLSEILGPEQWGRLWALRPSLGDLGHCFDAVMSAYGTEPGESSPSASSSGKAGGSSKPRSGGSTKRTRPASVSAA